MNRITVITTLLFALLITGFGIPANAEEAMQTTYLPAQIGNHEQSLARLIEFPKSKKDFQQAVKCESKIGESGRILATACFNGEKKYINAILNATGKATLKPASVNQELKSVYMLYTVIFVRKEGAERVIVVPNHSINMKEFGLAYIAPQRLVYKKYEYNLQCPDRPFYHLVTASIDSQGSISEVELSTQDKKCIKCRRCVEKVAAMSSFIPGYANSKPTTMKYQEPYFKGERSVVGYRGLNMNEQASNVFVDSVH